jgi:hypothetical protein
MITIRGLGIASLISCSCLATQNGYAQKDPDGAQLLSVAANGYRANLESFEYITCRYSITQGFAKSLEDGLAGRVEPGARISTVVFYKNGRTIRFHLEEDAETKTTLDKPGQPSENVIPGLKTGPIVPWTTTDYLLNENHGLIFDPRDRNANIYDAGTDKAKQVDSDYLLTQIHANTKFDYALLADLAARGEITAEVGKPMTNGELKSTFHLLGKNPKVEFIVDLNRGALPTRIEMVSGTRLGDCVSLVVVPQIRACSKERWFPERIVAFLRQFPTQSPCLFKEFKVTELDVDHRPSKDAFTLDIPAGSTILQGGHPDKSFKTRKQERIGPDDLDRIKELTEKVPEVPGTDTTIVAPSPSYTWLWYVLAGVVAVFGFFVLKKRVIAKREQHVPS